jgi:hypothetical protein
MHSTNYRWTKTSLAIVRQLKETGEPTPIEWLKVRAHLRTDAVLLLARQRLVYFVRDGVIALTARGENAYRLPEKRSA